MWRFSGQIVSFVGEMGSGKTLTSFKNALLVLEEERRTSLICNFSIDGKSLCRYLCRNGFLWSLKVFQNGGIVCRSTTPNGKLDLEYFLGDDRDAVYIYDEAGATANKRHWRDISTVALERLTQLRKRNRRLFWTAQFFDQVDCQLQELSSDIVLCRGANRYNSQLRAPELKFVFNRLYSKATYSRKIHNTKLAEGRFSSIFMSIVYARDWQFKRVDDEDILLLDACNSLVEVSSQPTLTNPWVTTPARYSLN